MKSPLTVAQRLLYNYINRPHMVPLTRGGVLPNEDPLGSDRNRSWRAVGVSDERRRMEDLPVDPV
jgi:hypothetical protein